MINDLYPRLITKPMIHSSAVVRHIWMPTMWNISFQKWISNILRSQTDGSYGCLSGYNCQQGISNWWRHIDAFHRRKYAIDHSYIDTLWRHPMQCIVPDERLQHKQGISDWCDSCDRRSNLTQVGSNRRFFRRVWPSNLMDDLTKNRDGTRSMLCQALCIILKTSVNWNCSFSPETPNSGQNRKSFCTVWPRNLTDDLEKQHCTFSLPLEA